MKGAGSVLSDDDHLSLGHEIGDVFQRKDPKCLVFLSRFLPNERHEVPRQHQQTPLPRAVPVSLFLAFCRSATSLLRLSFFEDQQEGRPCDDDLLGINPHPCV